MLRSACGLQISNDSSACRTGLGHAASRWLWLSHSAESACLLLHVVMFGDEQPLAIMGASHPGYGLGFGSSLGTV
jgi:hypothetical protein